LKRKFVFSRRVWISINIADKLLAISQIFEAKTQKMCFHVDALEGIVFLLLAFSVKAQMTSFHS
jgi:hypothetical protein